MRSQHQIVISFFAALLQIAFLNESFSAEYFSESLAKQCSETPLSSSISQLTPCFCNLVTLNVEFHLQLDAAKSAVQ